MSDLGFTHIALLVTDVDRSIAFYAKYAGMQVVHRRKDKGRGSDVAWISDLTRPFVIVLIKAEQSNDCLRPFSHLGVACPSKEIVDQHCEEARQEGILNQGPEDWGPPVGYWVFISDPDGHTLELSYGQEVAFAVAHAGDENVEIDTSQP